MRDRKPETTVVEIPAAVLSVLRRNEVENVVFGVSR
jgi:hypothetical protein